MEATAPPRTVILACGALAREIRTLLAQPGFGHVELHCLPAILHNCPDRIPALVEAKLGELRAEGVERVFVAYADCGTGGELDRVLERHGVERIRGPHCYAFYRGLDAFLAEAEREPATFWLTDYLVRHFDTLIVRGLGLDAHPELLPLYFGNYRKLVHLAQVRDAALQEKGRAAAQFLGLRYEYRFTGFGELAAFVEHAARSSGHGGTDRRVVAGHPGAGDRAGGPEDHPARTLPAIPGSYRSRGDARPSHRNRRLSRRVAKGGTRTLR
jgi:hypothetical protein